MATSKYGPELYNGFVQGMASIGKLVSGWNNNCQKHDPNLTLSIDPNHVETKFLIFTPVKQIY